jgi:hypothetical protein
MENTTTLKNMIQDFAPKEIKLIILEYLKEDIMLQEIKTIVYDDLCYADCQGNYDPPLRLCRGCQNIVNKIKELNNLRISIGKNIYREEELWRRDE